MAKLSRRRRGKPTVHQGRDGLAVNVLNRGSSAVDSHGREDDTADGRPEEEWKADDELLVGLAREW